MMPMAPPQFANMPVMIQGIPADVIEALRAEAKQQAEAQLSQQTAAFNKHLHLARVRVAELEKRVRVAEAEGDEMSTKLTTVELEKAQADRAREEVHAKLEQVAKGTYEGERVQELEEELRVLKEEKEDMDGLKRQVLILSKELKKRMKADAEQKEQEELRKSRSEDPEEADTDYTVTDSRSGSDTE